MDLVYLKIKQNYHAIPDGKIYGNFVFIAPLFFDIGRTWIIGREPLIDTPEQDVIYIPSVCVTRTIARIYSSRSDGSSIHVLESLSPKQKIIKKSDSEPVSRRILRSGDEFNIERVPISFSYKIKERSSSDEKSDDTYY
jgi:hypothetical protein